MARKRGNQEGGVYYDEKRKRWRGQYLAKNEEGKTIRKTFYKKSKKEVTDELSRILNLKNQGLFVPERDLILEDWIETWLSEYKIDLERTSQDNFRRFFRTHIKGSVLGKTKITSITSVQIQNFINEKKKSGRCDGTGALSSTSVKHIYNVINGALKQAYRNGMVIKNPCDAVVLPKSDRKEMIPLSPEEIALFMKYAEESEYYTLYLLEIYSGIRLGELLGLQWKDVDYTNSIIHIRHSLAIVTNENQEDDGKIRSELILKSPKTKKSIRDISIREPLITELKKLRKKQLELKMQIGDKYLDNGAVFQNKFGNWIHPKRLQSDFKCIVRKAGLSENVHFHLMRHSFASMLINEDVQMKIIQELLGHSDIQTTANIYSHVNSEKKKQTYDIAYKILGLKESSNYLKDYKIG